VDILNPLLSRNLADVFLVSCNFWRLDGVSIQGPEDVEASKAL